MTTYLQIGDDPTKWETDEPVDPSQLTKPTVPLPITAPLLGTLLISARAASIAVMNIEDGGPAGGIPSDFKVLVESLYLPTGTGAAQTWTGYQLSPGVNLGDLQTQIAALMTEGTTQTITLGSGANSAVVLNGATLPFVVLAPVNVGRVHGEPSVGGGIPSD